MPARAIFYPRLPDDLMTAPAHRRCQGVYNHDEAYFAEILDAARLGGSIAWMRRWAKRKSIPGAEEGKRLEAVIKKIIQGLHYRHTGRLLSPETLIRITPVLWEERANQYQEPNLNFHVRGNYGEFKYAFTPGANGLTTWILVFHERFMFRCEVIT